MSTEESTDSNKSDPSTGDQGEDAGSSKPHLDADEVLDRILAANTHYEVLGVETTATTTEIRSAYKKLALKYHPDKYKSVSRREDADRAFKKCADAAEVLSDPSARRQYDLTSTSPFPSSSVPMPSMPKFGQGDYAHSMVVFLSQLKADLQENPSADMSEAFPVILLGSAHVLAELLAYIGSTSPWLLIALGVVGGLTYLLTSQETLQAWIDSIHWNNLPMNVKLMLLEVIAGFYQQKVLQQQQQQRQQRQQQRHRQEQARYGRGR